MSGTASASRASLRARLEHDAESAAVTLPGLLIAAQRVAANINLGSHGRRRPGTGESFWQFRMYGSDDSPGAIDWRQSAKTDLMYIREREWAAAQTAVLWSDMSRSMHYRSSRNLPTKAERAAVMLLATGMLLVEGGERIVRLAPNGSRIRAASSGRLALMQAMDGRVGELAEPPGDAQPHFSAELPRHAAAVLFGDFLQPLETVHALLKPLADHGLTVHMVQILDPAEETLPFSGRIRFEGLEGEGNETVDRAEDVRGEYLERLARHRRGLKAMTTSFGWTFTLHHTDQSPEASLVGLHRMIAEGRR
ncbi:MAG: DUF58 domain-containing protein [Rhodobacteraceae bacterium]|nr:DUF58 domain-containing protein [Paracoccaceae bacterium]